MTTPRPILPSGRHPLLPAAVYYDGVSKDTIRDQYGVHRSVHPTDQGITMSLLVRRGSCKSAPDMGNDLHTIMDLKADDLAEQIRTVVNAAEPLARLVSAGKAQIVRIDYTAERGRLGVAVQYLNTETGERQSADWYS